MPIPVTCSCGKNLKAPDALAGRKAKCPQCGQAIAVPALAAAAAAAPAGGRAPARAQHAAAGAAHKPAPKARAAPVEPSLDAYEVDVQEEEAPPPKPAAAPASAAGLGVPPKSPKRPAAGQAGKPAAPPASGLAAPILGGEKKTPKLESTPTSAVDRSEEAPNTMLMALVVGLGCVLFASAMAGLVWVLTSGAASSAPPPRAGGTPALTSSATGDAASEDEEDPDDPDAEEGDSGDPAEAGSMRPGGGPRPGGPPGAAGRPGFAGAAGAAPAAPTTDANLRDIGIAILSYTTANNDDFPNSLDDLKPQLGAKFDQIMQNPRTKEKPGYVYVRPAKKYTDVKAEATTPMVYEAKAGQPDPDGQVLYVDGHVAVKK